MAKQPWKGERVTLVMEFIHARSSESLCLGTTDNNASVLLHSN